jgi:hypothetical protein
MVAASVEQLGDIGGELQAAKANIKFRYLVLPDGTRIPLHGVIDPRGRRVTAGAAIARAFTHIHGEGVLVRKGRSFAILAAEAGGAPV